MKKQGKQTVVQGPDQESLRYIRDLREYGQAGADAARFGPEGGGSYFTGPLTPGAISEAMNPYINTVIDPMRGEFDFARDRAALEENARATGAGAYGGDRAALAMGARMGELDRAEANQIAGLLHGGYGQAVQLGEHNRQLTERQLQEPLWRRQQGLNFLNLGMGPVGSMSEQYATRGRNSLGGILGGATAGSAFGPWGAGIGAGVGLLGELFG